MRKVLATFAYGPQEPLLDVSLPTFAKYAAAHGYDLFVPALANLGDTGRFFPWLKIPLIVSLLRYGYEAVLWLDADVAVLRYDRDILEDLGSAPMGLAVQRTCDGEVPSTGVWPVRRDAVDLIESLWPLDGYRRSWCWWEQAALIAALGGDPDADKVSVPAGPMWTELDYSWNPHVADDRGIPVDARFYHATMVPDRAAAMRDAIAQSENQR